MINTWKELKSNQDLDAAIKSSNNKPIVLFKHSVTCGISAQAKYMLEEGWDFDESDFDFYYLDLLSYRSISNEIADRLKVNHQSPQVLIVKNEESQFSMSHHKISSKSLKEALKSI